MDSLTHIASGALIGEAFFGKKLGKRAMLIGAAAQSLPDIDFVASFWLDPADDLLAHRGITHSILFGLLAAVVLAFITRRAHPKTEISVRQWIIFFLIEIATHLFLDVFNNYGTGLFEPFNPMRISFNTIFVLDPFYSLPLVIAAVVLFAVPTSSSWRGRVVLAGLAISSLYLVYAVYHKYSIDKVIQKNFVSQHIPPHSYFSTPTPFNQWLWYIVVEDSSGFDVGYHSVYDPNETIAFRFFPQGKNLLDRSVGQHDVGQLVRFSKGFYTVTTRDDTLVFNDLRFGQVAGWTNPEAPFAFHYYVNYPDANALVVQRGRFEGWNRKSISEFLDRIKGK